MIAHLITAVLMVTSVQEPKPSQTPREDMLQGVVIATVFARMVPKHCPMARANAFTLRMLAWAADIKQEDLPAMSAQAFRLGTDLQEDVDAVGPERWCQMMRRLTENSRTLYWKE